MFRLVGYCISPFAPDVERESVCREAERGRERGRWRERGGECWR